MPHTLWLLTDSQHSPTDIPEEKWTATFLLMDKLEKLPLDALAGEMEQIGLRREVVEDLVASLQVSAHHTTMMNAVLTGSLVRR